MSHICHIDESGDFAPLSSVLSIAANHRHILVNAGRKEKTRAQLRQEERIICDDQQQAKPAVRRIFRRRELPVPEFDNSKRRAGLQLADWLCSGIIAPLAAAACFNEEDLPGSKHVNARYLSLRDGDNSPWARLMRMGFPFVDDDGLRQPGILVNPERFRGRLFPEPIFGDEAE